ncbi:MAG: CoB--CoM heterodisulfide reductase iron-sulfur subunit B family protein [Candidatus Eisenbacteria bacterium]
MKFAYFPGCTMKGTAADYEASLRETLAHLDIELEELEDWNCCGASSAHMTDQAVDVGLTSRNLDLAQQSGHAVVVTPCPACYLRLRHGDHELRAHPERYGRESYAPRFEIKYLTSILAGDEMIAKIVARIRRPLTGFRLAAYYGCLSQRPPKITGARDHEHPTDLDRIIAATGATPVRWSHKTECCGGSLTVARADIVRELIRDITVAAKRGGAEAIVTDCAMCQANLESRQADLARTLADFQPLPVYFATEILAAALAGEGGATWAKGHLVDAGLLDEKLKAAPVRPVAAREPANASPPTPPAASRAQTSTD